VSEQDSPILEPEKANACLFALAAVISEMPRRSSGVCTDFQIPVVTTLMGIGSITQQMTSPSCTGCMARTQ
jgi:hypothetical protein